LTGHRDGEDINVSAWVRRHIENALRDKFPEAFQQQQNRTEETGGEMPELQQPIPRSQRPALPPAAAVTVKAAARDRPTTSGPKARTIGITSTAGRPRRRPGPRPDSSWSMPRPHNPNVAHHDLDDEVEMRHHDIEYRPTATAVH